MSNSSSTLRQLVNLISTSIDAIEIRFAKDGLTYPSLDTPFNPQSPAEDLAKNPELIQHIMTTVSACAQLCATVNVPMNSAIDVGLGFHLSAALRATITTNVVEILRDHPQGLHVNEIAAKGKSGIDPVKLARILRALSTHHVFIESAPDTFKNNRISSVLDTGKPVEEILAHPLEKHTGTPGLAAVMEHAEDEMFKGAAYLTETLLDPKLGHSNAQEDTSIARAIGFNKSLWEWFEEPGNEHRIKRFAAATKAVAGSNPQAVLNGFKWEELHHGDLVVDVGGGTGHNMLTIREKYPQFKFVVQDRQGVIDEAKKYWEAHAPDAVEHKDVILQAHDFFAPQPSLPSPPAVFFLSMIIHDYGCTLAQKILKHLRDAAGPQTKLVLVDQVVPYACSIPPESNKHIRGADKVQPQSPPPLLPNLGKANAFTYLGDLSMLVALNAEARTIKAYIELFETSGWAIEEIFPGKGTIQSQLVATAI